MDLRGHARKVDARLLPIDVKLGYPLAVPDLSIATARRIDARRAVYLQIWRAGAVSPGVGAQLAVTNMQII